MNTGWSLRYQEITKVLSRGPWLLQNPEHQHFFASESNPVEPCCDCEERARPSVVLRRGVHSPLLSSAAQAAQVDREGHRIA